MINFQLSHLKYISSEHPEDLAGLIDGKLKENIMETTVQLLFQHENQSKDTQNGIKRSNIENLDLAPSSSSLLTNNDMDLIPEIVGLYEDSDRVIDAIKMMKYKKASSIKEDSMIIERQPYDKIRDDGNKSRKEDNPSMLLEDHKAEGEDKSKINYRDNDVGNQKSNFYVNNYPDYSQPPFISNNSNVSNYDMRRGGPMNMDNPGKNKWNQYMPYHSGGNYGGDRGNMGNYDNYQQSGHMNYGQNMMNYKSGGYNNGTNTYYPNQNIPPPMMQGNYNAPPNYSTPPPNYSQNYYSNQYAPYNNAPYSNVNETSSNQIDEPKYSSGNSHQSSGKMYRDSHKDSGKQKHFDKR